ncbi:MAG TPA: hypothetical protein VK154_09875 [Chitinophagales bacterium]|nr:hypothetical protein [Chitinophagales bacterium]
MAQKCMRMLLVVFMLSSIQSFAQDATMQTWRSLMQTCQLSFGKIYETCPHFPVIDNYKDDAAFIGAVTKWKAAYSAEEAAFWKLEEVQRGNPSAYYLGLSDGTKPAMFESSVWEWVTNSKISDARLQELAAHFPKPNLTGDVKKDSKEYEQMLNYWMKLYPLEYEHLFNAPELTALNPSYTGYHKPVVIPAFLSAPMRETKPYREAYSNTINGELSYELSIRVWYFIYEPETFNKLYGNQYEFPEWFSPEKFRADVKQKIEWTKNTPKEVLESHPGK